MRKILTLALAALLAVCLITAAGCEDNKTDTHSFSSAYAFDEYAHWQQCTDEGCNEKQNYAEHNYQLAGTTNTCTVCGQSYNTANTYEVNLYTLGGTVISGVTVNLFDGSNQKVATAKTNVRGRVRFSEITPDDYVAKIDESTLPKGYYVPDELKEIQLSKSVMKSTVKLPSALIDEDMPNGHKYSVGQIAYNFKTTSVDTEGKVKNISLSAYLSQYNAVILNFWYASCSPCLAEFPFMNEAYLNYSNKIAVIAINSGSEDSDEIASFVSSTGYEFDFVNEYSMLAPYNNAFSVQAYPTTVVIDRYGAIAHIESGSIPSRSAWENMFEHYTSDDYVPDYVSKYNGDQSGGGDTLAKPDVEMPESEEVAERITKINSFTSLTTFTYSNVEDDVYSWPWVLDEREGVPCLKTSNKDRSSSYSILLIDVELKAGQQVFFDYLVSTEQDNDILYVQVDTVLQYTLSGEETAWNNDELLYVARRDGKYQISLTYQKSVMNNPGEDTVYIKNIRIEDGAEISGHHDLLYNATDNYTLDPSVSVPGEYKGYLNHVAYYYDEADGFYHVALSANSEQRAENDPVLLADLYYTTPWNKEFSVWNLAFSETGLFGKTDPDYKEGYLEAVEDYAWLQNNNPSRYVPVNKELQQILVDVVADLGRTDHSQDPHNGKDQWLETCRYYVHYGTDGGADDVCYSLDNTVEALKWRVAKDYGTMTEDLLNIYVDVYSVHLPRGNYYRFKTTKAGAYLIRSLEPIASDYDPDAQDTMGFICDDKGNILAENDNFIIEVQGYEEDSSGKERPLYDNNFYLHVYLEANKTYYVAGCFNDPYAEGEYDVAVEYLGETYSYLTACATDPAYTFDENDPNFTPFILPLMGKDRFFIGDDGKYYAQEFDGSQGSVIYVRLIGPTYLNSYTNLTLEQLIESDAFSVSEADKLYLKHLLIEARTTYPESHELYGYVEATDKLVSIINRMANGSDTEDSSTYSQTSWLLTAYYYRNIDELTLKQAQSKFN